MNKTKIDWATMSWNPVTGMKRSADFTEPGTVCQAWEGKE